MKVFRFALCLVLCLWAVTALAMSDEQARSEGNKLLQQLDSFRDSPSFKQHGFSKAKGNPGPEWLVSVQQLKKDTQNVEMGLSFSIMFLEDLGKAYASGNAEEITKARKSVESGLTTSQPQEDKAVNPVGHPLAVQFLAHKAEERNGRKRVSLTIMPAEDQSKATQADLAATAVAVATLAQKSEQAHIVNVSMVCQKAANSFGELQLAYVVYVPDGLGMTGKTPGKIWESLDAAPRGFTKQELLYLRLWAEMRGQFQTPDGDTDSGKLKSAIAKKMNIKPGSLNPFLNVREPVEGKLEIDGELKLVK